MSAVRERYAKGIRIRENTEGRLSMAFLRVGNAGLVVEAAFWHGSRVFSFRFEKR